MLIFRYRIQAFFLCLIPVPHQRGQGVDLVNYDPLFHPNALRVVGLKQTSKVIKSCTLSETLPLLFSQFNALLNDQLFNSKFFVGMCLIYAPVPVVRYSKVNQIFLHKFVPLWKIIALHQEPIVVPSENEECDDGNALADSVPSHHQVIYICKRIYQYLKYLTCRQVIGEE